MMPKPAAGANSAIVPAMLHYQTLPVTPFQQNCSIVWCGQTMEAAVIDPGGDLPRIKTEVQRLGALLKQILLTHAHIDHAGGTAALARELALPVVGPHPGDQFWIDGLQQQAQMFGLAPAEAFVPTRWLHDGDVVRVGEETLAVRPGHTPGHVVFYSATARRAFVGDVLFAGSIGRTDFPGGDHETLVASITQRLWPLGDETVFIPGHGPESTFGQERRHNPYVRGT
jgi:hydroxyacylglutathione hydrolase